jgi:hypothetical protein
MELTAADLLLPLIQVTEWKSQPVDNASELCHFGHKTRESQSNNPELLDCQDFDGAAVAQKSQLFCMRLSWVCWSIAYPFAEH